MVHLSLEAAQIDHDVVDPSAGVERSDDDVLLRRPLVEAGRERVDQHRREDLAAVVDAGVGEPFLDVVVTPVRAVVLDVDPTEFVVVVDGVHFAVGEQVGLVVAVDQHPGEQVQHPACRAGLDPFALGRLSRPGLGASGVARLQRRDQRRVERVRLEEVLAEAGREVDVVRLGVPVDVRLHERPEAVFVAYVADQPVAQHLADRHLIRHVHLDPFLSREDVLDGRLLAQHGDDGEQRRLRPGRGLTQRLEEPAVGRLPAAAQRLEEVLQLVDEERHRPVADRVADHVDGGVPPGVVVVVSIGRVAERVEQRLPEVVELFLLEGEHDRFGVTGQRFAQPLDSVVRPVGDHTRGGETVVQRHHLV